MAVSNYAALKKSRVSRAAEIEALERRQLLTTYYVSPTGSDSNNGTSQSTPWQTLTKVNASTYQPGDSILLQDGSQFRATLTASSGGTPTAPITFGSYGDSSLGNPEIIGSDVLNTSAFTLVSGTLTTYSLPETTTVNWVFDNHQFTQESQDALQNAVGSSMYDDEATNISYVKSNSETFYYDSAASTLYVNLGGALSGHIITAATRVDGVESNGKSNLVFQDINVTECAADNNTYGFNIQGGSNITVNGCTVTYSGKHAFGAIDTTGFVGENLTTSESAPDLGFGGASAYVSFSDSTRVGDTSQWINDTYTNPNGAYGALISHGTADSVGSVLVKNMVSDGTYGNGIDCQSTGPSEVVTIEGGEFGSVVEVDTDNSVISGVTMDQGDAGFVLGGNDDVLQNCVFTNLAPDVEAGHNGGVVVAGAGDVVRFNTFDFSGGPAVDISPDLTNVPGYLSNANVYANIFDCNQAILLYFPTAASATSGVLTSNDNLFGSDASFGYFTGGTDGTYTFQQWNMMGYDANSVVSDPLFADPSAGNYQLTASSPAIDLYGMAPNPAITTDFAGNMRPYGAGYDAGAYEFQSPKVPAVLGTLSGPTTANEPAAGDVALTFTVTVAPASPLPLTVNYTTQDGTALAGTDYVAASGTLSFAVGVTTQTFTVDVIPDPANQNNTSFTVALGTPSVGLQLNNSTQSVTINNLVVVPVSISGPATVNEPISGLADATYTVSLAQSSTQPITVDYATVPGTAVAGTDFSGVSGTVTFAAGQTSQTISVPILADVANQADTAFSVALSSPSAAATLSSTSATASTTIVNALGTTEPLNSRHQYAFKDGSGLPVTIQLSGPGSASVVFSGTTGTAANAAEILVTGTTAASTLSVTSRTGTTVGDILVTGSLRAISAAKITLSGRIAISGTVANITLAGLSGNDDIHIAGAGVPVSLALANVTDTTLESASAIRSLTFGQWLETGNGDSSITAPLISNISSKGIFDTDLHVAGALTTANVGALTGGTWSVGSANSITCSSAASGWSATFAGAVRNVTVLSVFIGSLTAPSVAAFTVRGALYSANLDINNLTKLSVTGAITSSTISGTNLLAVSAASISGSTILAGISAPATLPIATLGTGIIGSLTIKSAAGFDSTTVAAGTIKNVSLKAITYDNNGTPFGFEAQTYGTVSIPKLHWNSHEKIATLTAASKQDFEVIAG